MSRPWLRIIGIGEDGAGGLPDASRAALKDAEIVFGAVRHLELAGVGVGGGAGIGAGGGARGRVWGLPFSVAPVLALRGQAVAVLASGDPFWHGVGGVLAGHLSPDEWISYPAASSVSLAANRLGWRLEEVITLGLHAAPYERLVPVLAQGVRVICTLRDGGAAAELAHWLGAHGFGRSPLWVLEHLGGPGERIRKAVANGFDLVVDAPAVLAIEALGAGMPRGFGLADRFFATDGQLTKAPIRALTLAALAPRPGEMLWDIGAGSGSISVEWCLAGGAACCIEARRDRVANITANAAAFGLTHRMSVTEGCAPAALTGLAIPDAVFVGGGADGALLAHLWGLLPAGTRLVANAVTLETEALLVAWQAENGGDLWRFDVARATPLGAMRGWTSTRPVVQWVVRR